nr:MAG TPA: hypothetical protein [Caudoviricetes sp.]
MLFSLLFISINSSSNCSNSKCHPPRRATNSTNCIRCYCCQYFWNNNR